MCRKSEAAERLDDTEKMVHLIFTHGFEKPPVSIVQGISLTEVKEKMLSILQL